MDARLFHLVGGRAGFMRSKMSVASPSRLLREALQQARPSRLSPGSIAFPGTVF